MNAIRAALALVGDVFCPEGCAACDAIVTAPELYCHGCRAHVNVLGPPECECCGSPLPADGLCGRCATTSFAPVRAARAWAAYDGLGAARPVARALASFKYGGAQRLGRRLAAVMLARVPTDAPSVVAPVPLHPERLRRRGFNQSAVLARHIARGLGVHASLQLLERSRDTPTQTALTVEERSANVAGAFAVRSGAAVRDATVLLIDDVWTSGATARAAAEALRKAGAKAVDVVTFARVL